MGYEDFISVSVSENDNGFNIKLKGIMLECAYPVRVLDDGGEVTIVFQGKPEVDILRKENGNENVRGYEGTC